MDLCGVLSGAVPLGKILPAPYKPFILFMCDCSMVNRPSRPTKPLYRSVRLILCFWLVLSASRTWSIKLL